MRSLVTYLPDPAADAIPVQRRVADAAERVEHAAGVAAVTTVAAEPFVEERIRDDQRRALVQPGQLGRRRTGQHARARDRWPAVRRMPACPDPRQPQGIAVGALHQMRNPPLITDLPLVPGVSRQQAPRGADGPAVRGLLGDGLDPRVDHPGSACPTLRPGRDQPPDMPAQHPLLVQRKQHAHPIGGCDVGRLHGVRPVVRPPDRSRRPHPSAAPDRRCHASTRTDRTCFGC